MSAARLRRADAGDLPALQAFVRGLSLPTRRQRFFAPVVQLPPALADALRHGDPAQRFFVAEVDAEVVALGQLARVSDDAAEIALVVADRRQGLGLGQRLMGALLDDARRQRLQTLRAETLAGNRPMQRLLRRFGFGVAPHPDDPDLLLAERRLGA